MPTACVRFETRAALPAPLAKHLQGAADARPTEAIPREDRPPLDLGSDPDRAARAVEAARAVKRAGRKGAPYVDVIITGPPRWEAPDAWPAPKVDQWACESVAWIRNLAGPDVPVAVACLHTDEAAPHVHAAFVPRADDAKGPRLSWKDVQTRMVERATGRRIADSRQRTAELQTSYHAQVGARFGLDRGEPGSGRRHTAPDRAEGLRQRVRDAERREREAEDEREAADRRAREAEDARRRAEDLALDAQRRQSVAHQRSEADRRALAAARSRGRKDRERAQVPPPPDRTVERRPARTRGPSR